MKQLGNQILRSAPFRCFRGHCLSLLQGHDLHCLAVQCDRVFYACGDRCHGHLDRPVALSQAGHDSLVHADRDLDQTLGGRSDESILLYRFTPQIATNTPHKMQHWVSERNTCFLRLMKHWAMGEKYLFLKVTRVFTLAPNYWEIGNIHPLLVTYDNTGTSVNHSVWTAVNRGLNKMLFGALYSFVVN